MNFQKRNLLRGSLALLLLFALSAGSWLMPNSPLTPTVWAQGVSATLSPALSAHVEGLANDADAGMVIVAFKSSTGLREAAVAGADRAEAVQSLMLRIASPEDAEPIRSNPFACARAGRRNECPRQRGVVHYAGSGGARQAKIDDFYLIYLNK